MQLMEVATSQCMKYCPLAAKPQPKYWASAQRTVDCCSQVDHFGYEYQGA